MTERLAYDPWGKRRFINTTPGKSDTLDQIVGQKTDRGFTEHEHLDEVGVIHMNGRIYDPLMGRFMSADPFIQAPENLQSYNRYAYVLNNPMTMSDPSGYWVQWAVAAVAAVWASTTTNKEDKQAATWIAAIAVGYGAGRSSCPLPLWQSACAWCRWPLLERPMQAAVCSRRMPSSKGSRVSTSHPRLCNTVAIQYLSAM